MKKRRSQDYTDKQIIYKVRKDKFISRNRILINETSEGLKKTFKINHTVLFKFSLVVVLVLDKI